MLTFKEIIALIGDRDQKTIMQIAKEHNCLKEAKKVNLAQFANNIIAINYAKKTTGLTDEEKQWLRANW